MTDKIPTVLITGCSDGSLGSALAVALHEAGLHVYATARDPAKLSNVKALGISTLILDVQSESSIASCVSKIQRLDILINNAGAVYNMPVSDMSVVEAKKLFDLNVWSYIAVTQAFLPLLLKSKGMIVNHTSSASVVTLPFQSAYNASKAAMAVFSDTQRLELSPFGIRVIDIKSSSVQSNIMKNGQKRIEVTATGVTLPANSIYLPAKSTVEKSMTGEQFMKDAIPADQWAKQVTQNLLSKDQKPRSSPPPIIWTGSGFQLLQVRLATILPFGTLDGTIRKLTGLNVVQRAVKI